MGLARRYRRSYGNAGNVIRQLGRQCAYCGGHATTVDHFVPWSLTRDNRDENLVPACQRCNSIASDKRFGTFAEKRTYILDVLARKAGLVEVRCCGVTYARVGRPDRCPDCGELV